MPAATNNAYDPTCGPLLPRLMHALLLRRDFCDSVAAAPKATGPAAAIVCLAAITRESVGIYEISQEYKGWGLLLLLVAVFALVRWAVYATVMYPIARAVSGKRFGYTRLLRCLGFAETPAVMTVFGFLDERLWPWVSFAVGAWLLVATIVAVRAAADVTLTRAIVIGVIGFATYLALGMVMDFGTGMARSAPVAAAALTLRGTV